MRIWIVVLVIAWHHSAEANKLRGWTEAGTAIVDIEGTPHWCAPAAFELDGAMPEADCEACGATPCVAAGKLLGGMRSPDKQLALTKSESCEWTGHDGDIERCTQHVTVGRLGAVEHSDEVSHGGKRAKLSVAFRPDSRAVAIAFTGGEGQDHLFVIDLGAIDDRDRATKAAAELLAKQQQALAGDVYTADAALFVDEAARGALTPAEFAKLVGAATFEPAEIEASYDGHAAWVSFVAKAGDRSYRVTQLLVRDDKGWRIASGYWSVGLADADANAKASANQLPAQTELARRRQDVPEAVSVLGAMLRDGDPELAGVFSKRARVMVVGTAPAERFVGPKLLATAWKNWWKTGVRGARVRGGVSPRGTSGWIAANLSLTKTKDGATYQVPVRAWLVVDRNDGGTLEVVLSHVAVTR